MTLFSISDISKTHEETLLFSNISFGMEDGERVGLIGRNGAGKSTLLRIIAGVESHDTGTVARNSSIHYMFLDQAPLLTYSGTALHAVVEGKPRLNALLQRHAELCHADDRSPQLDEELHEISYQIDQEHGWNAESDARGLLDKLGITNPDKFVSTMSGGQKKRVALARALFSSPDLLILDEPTNHLDTGTVQWLQDELQSRSGAVLFITHDRYFLDAVSTKIIELDRNKMFVFPGSYEKYLERKEQFEQTEESTADHVRNKIRQELAWLQKGAKARRTKQQSRINWIEKMTAEKPVNEQRDIAIEIGNVFLGSRVIDAHNISKSIEGKELFKQFTYNAVPGDKIGIIGPNGCGKSTLLNILCNRLQPDTGTVKIGETVKIGYFRQEVEQLPPTMSVIGAIRDVAEYIDTGVGRDRYISARELLERFQFPPHRHGSRIETLSGGERRRLELCRILMNNPNVLLLDEPTNDFDLATLTALEDYLQNFKGVLIVVSHDRSFLDKTVEFVYAFENGGIKQYPGNYTSYLETKEYQSQKTTIEKKQSESTPQQQQRQQQTKKGLSYKEQREFDILPDAIDRLEEEIAQLEEQLGNYLPSEYLKVQEQSTTIALLRDELDTAMMRWMELDEKKTG